MLVRWDPSGPANFGNMVLMTKHEAAQHVSLSLDEINKHYGPDILSYIQTRFQKEKLLRQLYY